MLEGLGKRDHDQLLWQIAASPYADPAAVIARREGIERGQREAAGRDRWLAEVAERAAANRREGGGSG